MNRQVYREMFSQRIGANTVLTFRAVRILDGLGLFDREAVVVWLNRPSTRNTRSLGAKTYYEICAAMGMAVPAKAPTTLGAKLRAAEAHIAKLEQELAHFMELHGKDGMNKAGEAILLSTIKNLETLNENQAQVIHDLRIENSGQAAEIERLKKEVQP